MVVPRYMDPPEASTRSIRRQRTFHPLKPRGDKIRPCFGLHRGDGCPREPIMRHIALRCRDCSQRHHIHLVVCRNRQRDRLDTVLRFDIISCTPYQPCGSDLFHFTFSSSHFILSLSIVICASSFIFHLHCMCH